MKARFLSTAERELREAVEFYEAAENGLGARFLEEVEAAVARIIAHWGFKLAHTEVVSLKRPEPRKLFSLSGAEVTQRATLRWRTGLLT